MRDKISKPSEEKGTVKKSNLNTFIDFLVFLCKLCIFLKLYFVILFAQNTTTNCPANEINSKRMK